MLPSEIDPYLFVLSVALFFERTAELPKNKKHFFTYHSFTYCLSYFWVRQVHKRLRPYLTVGVIKGDLRNLSGNGHPFN